MPVCINHWEKWIPILSVASLYGFADSDYISLHTSFLLNEYIPVSLIFSVMLYFTNLLAFLSLFLDLLPYIVALWPRAGSLPTPYVPCPVMKGRGPDWFPFLNPICFLNISCFILLKDCVTHTHICIHTHILYISRKKEVPCLVVIPKLTGIFRDSWASCDGRYLKERRIRQWCYFTRRKKSCLRVLW